MSKTLVLAILAGLSLTACEKNGPVQPPNLQVAPSPTTPSPVCGKVNDKSLYVPPNWNDFTPPAVGQSYVDPVFGCTVKRLTDGSQESLWDGTHLGLMNYYSTFSAISATGTLVFVIGNEGDWRIYDTNGHIAVSVANMPGMSGHPVWDAADGSVFYFASNNVLYKGTVSGGSVSRTASHTFDEYGS